MNSKKTPTPLPIGKSLFSKVIEEGCYYVDKTLFIKDLLDKCADVTLCTRPRRFGKTLNQTMLKYFFEDTSQIGGKDTRKLFNGLKIESAGDEYMIHQGKYPVIFLSFKEGKRNTFEFSYNSLKDELVHEFKRHNYVSEKISDNDDMALFKKLRSGEGTLTEYAKSLKFLCECLTNYYNVKPIVLIDEYDVPLENSWSCGFYSEMIGFIRPLLSALKDCSYLQFAVITGCLRISKESIFTGMNHLDVISICNRHYAEYFGFTQDEMDAMLKHYGLMEKRELIRDWYNGYIFGEAEVYNPWSSIKVISDWVKASNTFPLPYWSTTSSNDIVRKLIEKSDREMKDELGILMSGKTISKVIQEDITYDEVYKNADNLWNFLFFTGYLKKVGERMDGVKIIFDLSIPNLELRYVYETKIQEWFNEQIIEKNLDTFYTAIIDGDTETFQKELEILLMESISFMDTAENFYHGFMAGILSRLKNYRVKSNRESGHGRTDLALYAEIGPLRVIIFELKSAKSAKEMSTACDAALKQIEDNNYAEYWKEEEGYTDIMKYGIAFYKKRCEVRCGK